MQTQKGISLLEMLLVIILMAVMIFIAINRYQVYERQKDIVAVQQNVATLMHATNLYYRECCSASNGTNSNDPNCSPAKEPPKFDVSIAALQKAGLISPPYLIKTKLVSPNGYSVNAIANDTKDQNGKLSYRLFVSARLNVPANTQILLWYQQVLQAQSIYSTLLTWMALPGYEIKDRQTGLWILDANLREFKNKAIIQGAGDDTCSY